MSGLPPILKLHNRYRQTGGEEAVVAAEYALLASAGHDASLREMDNADIAGLSGSMASFAAASGSEKSGAWLERLLDETGAGIVHVHNFFPLLSPTIHLTAARRGVAVVQTLHNYRLLCAAATFLRDGEVCEKCVSGGRKWALIHRCYRGSLAGSLASIRMQRATIGSRQWLNGVHRFIALSEFARQKMIAGGLPAERVVVKGNFLESAPVPPETPMEKGNGRTGVIYVGRLSAEKGVRELIEAWRALPDLALTIIGTGPLEAELKAGAPPNVRFAGHRSAEEVAGKMRCASLLVMPSLWYEGFPRTMVEAFARKLPVIASDLGSLREIAGEGRLARLVEPGNIDALSGAVRQLMGSDDERGRLAEAAHGAYLQHHTAEINLGKLEDIYRAALGEVAQAPATGLGSRS